MEMMFSHTDNIVDNKDFNPGALCCFIVSYIEGRGGDTDSRLRVKKP